MIAFDIETEGIDPVLYDVNCVCFYDGCGFEASVMFCDCRGDTVESAIRKNRVLQILDGADQLCAFNGVNFDVYFLAVRWGLGDERVGRWVQKMVDLHEACALCLRRYVSLRQVALWNPGAGVVKDGSGLDAISYARDGELEKLSAYCMNDARLVWCLAQLEEVDLYWKDKKYTVRRKATLGGACVYFAVDDSKPL